MINMNQCICRIFVVISICFLGKPVGVRGTEILNHVANPKDFEAVVDPSACESCFGAETDTIKCCNSCDELRDAYRSKGWSDSLIVRNATQCLRDTTNPFASVRIGEGCRVTGTMSVNKVAGNIHMALGTSIIRDGSHIHQFAAQDAPGFNVSHTVHRLSFGNEYPSMPPNPLDAGTTLYTFGFTSLYFVYLTLIHFTVLLLTSSLYFS